MYIETGLHRAATLEAAIAANTELLSTSQLSAKTHARIAAANAERAALARAQQQDAERWLTQAREHYRDALRLTPEDVQLRAAEFAFRKRFEPMK